MRDNSLATGPTCLVPAASHAAGRAACEKTRNAEVATGRFGSFDEALLLLVVFFLPAVFVFTVVAEDNERFLVAVFVEAKESPGAAAWVFASASRSSRAASSYG